jgi:hypothetical protein
VQTGIILRWRGCRPDGSHLAMYDDQAVYFAGLIDFLHGLEGS